MTQNADFLAEFPWWERHPQEGARIPRSFFARPTLEVARDLLGARLVRWVEGQRVAGIVVETEAYIGETDLGCHARAGRTPRTEVMYGPPGYAYVYFNYGMHWLFNVVTEEEGFPAAVLLRALLPIEGLTFMARQRQGRPVETWANGPAKLCQALAITGAMHGLDLCQEDSPLFFEFAGYLREEGVVRGPRVGLHRVPEPWRSIPWRFRLRPQAYREAVRRLWAIHTKAMDPKPRTTGTASSCANPFSSKGGRSWAC